MTEENRLKHVADEARRILEAIGMPETSDSSRRMYTEGDMNMAIQNGVIEIIFRGTLVFRYALEGTAVEPIFEEHGVWRKEVERIARSLPE